MSGLYPPGCSGTPFDEYHTLDLSLQVSRIMGEPCEAYWGEDGVIFAMRASERKGSEDSAPRLDLIVEWNDDYDEASNCEFAAERAACFIARGAPR